MPCWKEGVAMWRVAIDIELADSAGQPEVRRAFYSRVMDEIARLDADTPDLEGDLAGTVRLSVGMDPDGDFARAICDVMGTFRTAIHAAGAATPDWPPCTDLAAADDGTGTLVVSFRGQDAHPVPVTA
jgi:hypothetical protein